MIRKLHRPPNKPDQLSCWCKPRVLHITEHGTPVVLHYDEDVTDRSATPEQVAQMIINTRFRDWEWYDQERRGLMSDRHS